MKSIVRLLDRMVVFAAWGAAAMAVLMMLLVSADVAGRGIFGSPITGTVEVASAYCMTAIAFLPLGLITLRQEHITVGVFTDRLSERLRSLFDAFAEIITLIYTGAATYLALVMAIEKTGIREAREAGLGLIEIWPARWLVAVGFALMVYCVAVRLVRRGGGGEDGRGSEGARMPEGLP